MFGRNGNVHRMDGGAAGTGGWKVWGRIGMMAMFLCLTAGMTAFADVIWTPDDTFYEENYEDCEYVGRSYYANGPKGYISVMERPDGGRHLAYISNGPIFFVSMTYDKGAGGTWGLVQYHMDGEGLPEADYSWEEDGDAVVGWIDMDSLLAVYDGYTFAEEHEAQIKDTDAGSMPEISIPDEGVIYLWEFPGSVDSCGELHFLEGEMVIDKTYEEPDGDVWGHSSYYYGYKNFWINMSNPGQTVPAAETSEAPELVPAMDREQLSDLPARGQEGTGITAAAAILVTGTVILTAVLIYVMASRRRKEH